MKARKERETYLNQPAPASRSSVIADATRHGPFCELESNLKQIIDDAELLIVNLQPSDMFRIGPVPGTSYTAH